MDTTYIQARIDKIKALIEAYEDVILLIAANPTRSFTINTGQTQETVTQKDSLRLQETLDGWYNQLTVWEARLYGGAVSAVPGW